MSQKGHLVLSFPSFHPFVGDRANTLLARQSGAKCFCRPFDTRFILGDRGFGNLKTLVEKVNLF